MRRTAPTHRGWSRGRRLRTLAVILTVVVTIGAGAADFSNQPDADLARPASAPSASAPSPPRSGPEEPPGSGVAPMTASIPARLRIPAIGVDSDLMALGLQDDGTLQVPPDAFPAGWFTGAPTPGELGPAIIAGHVRFNKEVGVFESLADLEADDRVKVAREDGTAAVFGVTRVKQFPKERFPTARVYGNIKRAGLRLITCDGLDPQAGIYQDNLVVFADLLAVRPTEIRPSDQVYVSNEQRDRRVKR